MSPKHIEFLGLHEAIHEIDGSKTHRLYIVNKVEVDRYTVQITEPDKCLKQGWFKKDNFPTPLMSQFPPVLEKFSSLL